MGFQGKPRSENEPDLRTQILDQLKRNKPEAKREESNHYDEPRSEGELSKTKEEMSNVIYFNEAAIEERDENRSITPPSPCYF